MEYMYNCERCEKGKKAVQIMPFQMVTWNNRTYFSLRLSITQS